MYFIRTFYRYHIEKNPNRLCLGSSGSFLCRFIRNRNKTLHVLRILLARRINQYHR